MFVGEASESHLHEQRIDPVAELTPAFGPVFLPERRNDLQGQHHVVAQR